MRWTDTQVDETCTLHHGLFYRVPIISGYVASELWDCWQMMTGRDLEGSGHGLYYTGVGLEGLRKTTSVSKTSFPANIRCKHVPNASLKYYQAVR